MTIPEVVGIEAVVVVPIKESDEDKLARLGQEIGLLLAAKQPVSKEQLTELADLHAKVAEAQDKAVITAALHPVIPSSKELAMIAPIMREHKVKAFTIVVVLPDGVNVMPMASLSLGAPTREPRGGTRAGRTVTVAGRNISTTHASGADAIRAYESEERAKAILATNVYNTAKFNQWVKAMAGRGYTVTIGAQ